MPITRIPVPVQGETYRTRNTKTAYNVTSVLTVGDIVYIKARSGNNFRWEGTKQGFFDDFDIKAEPFKKEQN